ncbi:unnamed protein product [Amaranthus hypochondriacus]
MKLFGSFFIISKAGKGENVSDLRLQDFEQIMTFCFNGFPIFTNWSQYFPIPHSLFLFFNFDANIFREGHIDQAKKYKLSTECMPSESKDVVLDNTSVQNQSCRIGYEGESQTHSLGMEKLYWKVLALVLLKNVTRIGLPHW